MYRIGVDLGGTNIAVGLVNEKYEIVARDSVPTRAERSAEEIIIDMAAVCKKLIANAGVDISEIISVGIAAPGAANTETGYVEYANNLHFINTPVADMLKKYLPIEKVYVANDANAAAWGEAIAGAAKGTSNSVMITLGTGVGGGIIIDNKIYSGFNMMGGELGHIVIEHNGRPCSCGRRGCWEAYSSATALVKMTEEKLEECKKSGRKTLMTDLVAERGKVTGRTACDAMRRGDEAAKEVYDMYISYLACGITNIINIFQPEVVSIGGGISNEGQSLIDAIFPTVSEERYGGHAVPDQTEIRIAELKNDAGIIGAAVLGV